MNKWKIIFNFFFLNYNIDVVFILILYFIGGGEENIIYKLWLIINRIFLGEINIF